jgi:hypothetical protein
LGGFFGRQDTERTNDDDVDVASKSIERRAKDATRRRLGLEGRALDIADTDGRVLQRKGRGGKDQEMAAIFARTRPKKRTTEGLGKSMEVEETPRLNRTFTAARAAVVPATRRNRDAAPSPDFSGESALELGFSSAWQEPGT